MNANTVAKVTMAILIGLLLCGTNSQGLKVLTPQADQETYIELGQGLATVPLFTDEFNGSALDEEKWEVMRGDPTVSGGKLKLLGGTTRTEIQSKAQFQAGVWHAEIKSAEWRPQNEPTDSSFGFEIWTGANSRCHYGVILVANGHLGILRPQPDGNNNCAGDPAQQVYVPISNWDTVRTGGNIFLTIMWSAYGVTLQVSDGTSNRGQAVYAGEANPDVPLEIRLNADIADTYHLDRTIVYEVEERKILVDDFVPQPLQNSSFWPHNRLNGDRGEINPGTGNVLWGQGTVTATITTGMGTQVGGWTSLNHPINDCTPLNFSSIFSSQIKSQYQGRLSAVRVHIKNGQGTFQVILQNGENAACPPQTSVFTSAGIPLKGGEQTLHFPLPVTLSQVGNLNWLVSGNAEDFVVIDRVELVAELPQLDTSDQAFLWSYAMLLANWDSAGGLTRDSARFAAGEFDNISASGMQAAAAVMAWRLGFISEASANEIVSKTSQSLLALPDCHGLWPHFVKDGQIISGTEWSSIDSIIALVALIEARQALRLDTSAVEQVLMDIDWDALILEDGSISHGYNTNCNTRIEGGWQDFGTESWLVNFGYSAARANVAEFDHTPPTHNGSGFIDELAWLLAPPPCDWWGTDWHGYRTQAANCQLTYYRSNPPTDCLYYRDHSFYENTGLFGLSAAEVPDLSAVPVTQTYQAFGTGGEIPPNDGTELLGYAVIVPHYAAMASSLRTSEATALWDWVQTQELFTPLNNVESLACQDKSKSTCTQITWNAFRGSWNLSLQVLGWGRLLAGSNNPLYQSLFANDKLRNGYNAMSGPTCRNNLPLILKK